MKSQLFIPRHLKRRSLSAVKHMQARYELARRRLRGQGPIKQRTLHMDLTERLKAAGNDEDSRQAGET